MRLLLGTTNVNKGVELAALLQPLGIEVVTLADLDNPPEIVEDGATFADNALLKARGQALHFSRWVMAEDSGLAVDYLDGRPGIYSARFAGESATDEENNDLLLSELADVPRQQRTAHYVCEIILCDASGDVRAQSRGICRGLIRTERAGNHGFGYDPLFEVREYHKTFGQLGPHVKAAISHRSRALRALVPQLVALRDTGWDLQPNSG